MSSCKNGSTFAIVMSAVISIAVAITSGILFPVHFLFAGYVGWIAMGFGVLALILMFIGAIVDKRRMLNKCMCDFAPSAAVGIFGILASSILYVSLGEARTVLHAVIFGSKIGFLCFLLLIILNIIVCAYKSFCRKCDE